MNIFDHVASLLHHFVSLWLLHHTLLKPVWTSLNTFQHVASCCIIIASAICLNNCNKVWTYFIMLRHVASLLDYVVSLWLLYHTLLRTLKPVWTSLNTFQHVASLLHHVVSLWLLYHTVLRTLKPIWTSLNTFQHVALLLHQPFCLNNCNKVWA